MKPKPKKRDPEDLLAKAGIVHIVPNGGVAVCGEGGPFRSFFTCDRLEPCSECYAARPGAASPREALVAFFGDDSPTVCDSNTFRRLP